MRNMASNYVNMVSDVLATCTEVPANEERQEEAVVGCVFFSYEEGKGGENFRGEKNFAAKSKGESSKNLFGEYINYQMKIYTSCIF